MNSPVRWGSLRRTATSIIILVTVNGPINLEASLLLMDLERNILRRKNLTIIEPFGGLHVFKIIVVSPNDKRNPRTLQPVKPLPRQA